MGLFGSDSSGEKKNGLSPYKRHASSVASFSSHFLYSRYVCMFTSSPPYYIIQKKLYFSYIFLWKFKNMLGMILKIMPTENDLI